jgi:hypothetical protein
MVDSQPEAREPRACFAGGLVVGMSISVIRWSSFCDGLSELRDLLEKAI